MRYIHELIEDAGTKNILPLNGCPVRLHEKNKVNIIALGDVGTAMLTGLRLLGSDLILETGIIDLNRNNLERLEMEINQIGYPFGMKDLPPVHIVEEDELFNCDLVIFCASKGVPPVRSGYSDVRMAQLDANREIIAHYAGLARKAEFRGMVAVVSDPVDNLAAAFLDASGLEPWQIQGYGLGVMNKRAEYHAEKLASAGNAEAALYKTEGRAFGPHGKDLVIANSIEHYDDDVSRLLTGLAAESNLRVRDLGFKPYIAPAMSSAAISILLTLSGDWHYGSIYIGSRERGAFLGVKNRLTWRGFEYEDLPLPEPLYERILAAYKGLCDIR